MVFFYLFIFITSNISEYNVHYYYRKKKLNKKHDFYSDDFQNPDLVGSVLD